MDELINLVSGLKIAEVQKHGFTWDKDIILNVYGATEEEMKKVGYTNKIDLPSTINHLDHCDLSIKTSGNLNSICMGDCLRIFDSVCSGDCLHMVVINYKQELLLKKVIGITEIILTNSCKLLFGDISRSEIEELDKAVKLVPQKRKPDISEYNNMYAIKKELQKKSGAIRVDIKCNSTQSRLQCSFNHFQLFIQNNKDLIVAQSKNNEFRGGKIMSEIESKRRNA